MASNPIMLKKDSLVNYKKRPARLLAIGERLEIQLEDGSSLKVRPKDIFLIHPGPIQSLARLVPLYGDIELAWQLLLESGGEVPLQELTSLVFGEYSPQAAWAAWLLVDEGLYFYGDVEGIRARSKTEVENELAARLSRAELGEKRKRLLDRMRTGELDPVQDKTALREVEDLALHRREDSPLLKAIGQDETPEGAHALLLKWGRWPAARNPYPLRLGVPTLKPDLDFPPLPEEPRLDLTGIPAYAIDDEENADPDDALSLIRCNLDQDGRFVSGSIWVHIADPAACILPHSDLDQEACRRGATCYLPEGVTPMLPSAAIDRLALGMQASSPALSFELEFDQKLGPRLLRLAPSWVKVHRSTYKEVESSLAQEPFCSLHKITQAFERVRIQNRALSIDLPEVIVRVQDGEVQIRQMERLQSRAMVREAMLMAGEAAGRFAHEHGILIPFTTQEAPIFPDTQTGIKHPPSVSNTASEAFAIRRYFKRSQLSFQPGAHSGLGLAHYSRITSPLRRYPDLLAHQQLRAFMRGEHILQIDDLLQRTGAAEAAAALISEAEALSRRHWTLVYLLQHPSWRGQAVLVAKYGLRGQVLIPELALESTVHLRSDLPLDSELPVRVQGVDLAQLDAFLRQD